ncbi:MAG: hypothetical protein QW795_03460 [Candidatus Bathyarchaeia archaeon]
MAMRAYILGQKAVVKESGGKYFLSRAVPWTDAPEKRPKAVVERNIAFTQAVKRCVAEPKSKAGTVWGVSKFNQCIAEALKKA